MSTTVLTRAAVAEALDKVIVERGGDFVYDSNANNGCFYANEDGTPGCIVGAVLAIAAPESFETLKNLEAPTDDGNGILHRTPCGPVLSVVQAGYVKTESEALTSALRRAQSEQDGGATWEAARAAFVASLIEADESERRYSELLAA